MLPSKGEDLLSLRHSQHMAQRMGTCESVAPVQVNCQARAHAGVNITTPE